MDYEGQKLCENLFYWIIIIFGAIGWVYGYIEQDFVYVFYAWSVGMVISLIVSTVMIGSSKVYLTCPIVRSFLWYYHDDATAVL